MDVDAGILILALAWIVLLAVSISWGHATNRGTSIVTWLGLTFVTWCVLATFAFFAINVTYFMLGRPAAIVAAIATLVIVSLTPVAWAYGLRQWGKYRSAHP